MEDPFVVEAIPVLTTPSGLVLAGRGAAHRLRRLHRCLRRLSRRVPADLLERTPKGGGADGWGVTMVR